jgi:hypothetical protein
MEDPGIYVKRFSALAKHYPYNYYLGRRLDNAEAVFRTVLLVRFLVEGFVDESSGSRA